MWVKSRKELEQNFGPICDILYGRFGLYKVVIPAVLDQSIKQALMPLSYLPATESLNESYTCRN